MKSNELTPEQKASLKQFFIRRTEADSTYTCSKTALLCSFLDWIETRNEKNLSYTHLRLEMADRGFTEHRNKTTRYWKGLRLVVLNGSGEIDRSEPSLGTSSTDLGSEYSVIEPESRELLQARIEKLVQDSYTPEPLRFHRKVNKADESAVEILLRRNMRGF